MARYDLTHLKQPAKQLGGGAIQDDEALFLYSIVLGMRLKRILEIGGLDGYSATNFLVASKPNGIVYTCDVNDVRKINANHITIKKSAADLTPEDFDGIPLELVFFDCHVYDAQMKAFDTLSKAGIITDKTVLVLHDTNTFPTRHKLLPPESYAVNDGTFVHQPVERMMVNDFVAMGYSPFLLHTTPDKHSEEYPYRKGVAIMTKFKTLEV